MGKSENDIIDLCGSLRNVLTAICAKTSCYFDSDYEKTKKDYAKPLHIIVPNKMAVILVRLATFYGNSKVRFDRDF